MRSTSGAAPLLMAGITFRKLRIVTNVTARIADIRILLIRLSALGDVVHTIPAAALLRRKLPDAKLTWVVEAPFVALLQNNPVVDEVIVFPKKKISAELNKPLQWLNPEGELRRFAEQLRTRKFTAAIDFQGLFKSGAIAFLSGAPTRVGYAQAREFSSLLLTNKLDAPDYFSNDKHVVVHNMGLAEFFLRIAVGTQPKDEDAHFVLPNLEAGEVSRVLSLMGEIPEPEADMSAESGSDSASASGAQSISSSGATGSVEPPVAPLDAQPYVEPQGMQSGVISQPPAGPASGAISQPPAGQAPNTVGPPHAGASAASPYRDGVSTIEGAIGQPAFAGQSLIVLIPGTTWITKIWPESKWAELVSRLVQLHDVRIVLVGGPAEAEMNSYIYDRVCSDRSSTTPVVNLTGQTSLKDLMALFVMADIVIGADTGPLHMAAATGIPDVIGIYGSTPWRRNGPFGKNTSVVALDLSCQPCFQKTCPIKTLACLKDLEVGTVFNQIKKVREERSQRFP